ncbi:MAG: hypothetical protein HOW97_15840 [Catenulispora sp.]|nr:hypothetical protein [Catenulispora sp.]
MIDDDAADEEMFADLGRFEPGAIPVDTVMRRGRGIRLRRRLVGGGALVLAACLVVLAPTVSTTLQHGFGGSRGTQSPGSGVTDVVAEGPPHRIELSPPSVDGTGKVNFTGSIDGKQWSYTAPATCDGQTGRCMDLIGLVLPPVSLLLAPTHDGNTGVAVEFDRYTDHAVVSLSRGERFTVTAVGLLAGGTRPIGSGYFEIPRGETVTNIAAYAASDGSLIGNADPRPLGNFIPTVVPWHRPDGRVVELNAPELRLAQGGSGSGAWTLDVQVGSWDNYFVYYDGRGSGTVQSDAGPLEATTIHRRSSGVLSAAYGLVDGRAKRVDIDFSDGTSAHLVPVVSGDRAFAGTVAPPGATVTGVAEFDASGTLIPRDTTRVAPFPAWLHLRATPLTGTNS